jgi:hypothetical protein
MRHLLIAALLVCGLGCSKGMIRADAIDGLVNKVCDRHDALLTGAADPASISDEDKATYLRSTRLLRELLKEAQK